MKSNYRPLQILARQFKSCMSVETSLKPEERKNHEFHLLAMIDGVPVLIVKGGANTIGYRIGNADMAYVHPVQMVDLLEDWQRNPFVSYTLVTAGGKRKSSTEVGPLLQIKPKEQAKIYGHTITAKRKLLHTWQPGVFNGKWVKK